MRNRDRSWSSQVLRGAGPSVGSSIATASDSDGPDGPTLSHPALTVAVAFIGDGVASNTTAWFAVKITDFAGVIALVFMLIVVGDFSSSAPVS